MRRLVTALVTVALALTAIPAAARTVAHWRMNEHRGATVLHDAAHHHNGHIGRHVQLGGGFHYFPLTTQHRQVPGHIDVVPDSPALDPGRRSYTVIASVQFHTMTDRNIVQKGQGSPAGGIFKMKVKGVDHPGWVECIYNGSYVDSGRDLGNGRFHRVKCVSNNHGTTMFVDGRQVDHNPKTAGRLNNTWPVAIGGNTFCWEGAARRCNYFRGRIGDIVWQVS